jgi:hypothetical protein
MLRLFSISFVLSVVLKLFSASQFSIYLKIPHLQALTSVAGPPFKRAKSQWELYQCFFSDVSRQIFSHLHDSVMLPLRNLGFAVTFLLLFFFPVLGFKFRTLPLGGRCPPSGSPRSCLHLSTPFFLSCWTSSSWSVSPLF